MRHTALPDARAATSSCATWPAACFAQPLDRAKPLWEIYLVEGLEGEDRFALISKTHHALVDGVTGVDITSVLFDTSPDPCPPRARTASGRRSPSPSAAEHLTARCWSARRCPARPSAACAPLTRGPRQTCPRSASASSASARWPGPA